MCDLLTDCKQLTQAEWHYAEAGLMEVFRCARSMWIWDWGELEWLDLAAGISLLSVIKARVECSQGLMSPGYQ